FRDAAILLHESDNVAVLRRPLKAGDELLHGPSRLRITEPIAAGHKLAITTIPAGTAVRKYGQVIGFAQIPIPPGAHVHTHNLVIKDFGRDYQFCADARATALYPPEQMQYFQGYARHDGRVGTRNYIAVISSVNCSASVSHYVRDRFRTEAFKR